MLVNHALTLGKRLMPFKSNKGHEICPSRGAYIEGEGRGWRKEHVSVSMRYDGEDDKKVSE